MRFSFDHTKHELPEFHRIRFTWKAFKHIDKTVSSRRKDFVKSVVYTYTQYLVN